ncbi:MAG: hypothetical protein JW812_01130 [Alphaproteobacteria bacterium]|nr:hypothetical protein [Alphaproteobacteria bacterium]MBN2779614.1 hypothetical protein [Alphaproteobacteria bacterium]
MKTDLHFIILVAGSGTRNYPHSKGLPHKALLPFGDFKVIDQIMKNLVDAGGRKFTFVISSPEEKGIFDQCFVHEPKVEDKFARAGKDHLVNLLTACYLPDDVSVNYVVQENPMGTGHAVALAAKDGENIAMVLPDDIVLSEGETPYQRAVIEYERTQQGNVILTHPIENRRIWGRGVVEDGKYIERSKNDIPGEAGTAMMIFDQKVVARLKTSVEKMNRGETPDGMVSNELAWAHALNTEVDLDKTQKIRTIPFSKNDIYLDCGTIETYEKAMIYTLLRKSIFRDQNLVWVKNLLAS